MSTFAPETLAALPLVSVHNSPQPSPQQYDCGCVTAVHVTDRDFLNGERPFEMRLVESCDRSDCELRQDACLHCDRDASEHPVRSHHGWCYTHQAPGLRA
jgi:hypothetical protein